MTNNVRVRFAPSPTGPLHIGGIRTALFNYLFAKKHNGTFILRIEDTDLNRLVIGAEEYIKNALNWCEIPYDEGPGKNEKFGPYKQSERKGIYKQYADTLIKTNKAYYAFDTAEDLDVLRKQYEVKGETFIYNWHNRKTLKNSFTLTEKEIEEKLNKGDDYVIRFKTEPNKTIYLNDIIRGKIDIDSSTLDDKVLFKSDGMPTYHLANIVDDYLMQITHVIRGEEWLPSLALHFQLYEAFGWKAPQFAHLPLILKPTGKGKLSKRDGDQLGFPVFPLAWKDEKNNETSAGFKDTGYFSDALINFLAFLGWNPGTEQELFNLEALIKTFDLNKVNNSGARFDPEKIKWYNHQYMQQKDNDNLAVEFQNTKPELAQIDINYISIVVGLIKERATFISDFWNLSHYFFSAPNSYDDQAIKKAIKAQTKTIMQNAIQIIKINSEKDIKTIQAEIKNWITASGISFGEVMMPLRVALVGSLQGPDVFEIMHLIGTKESIKRIETLISKI